MPLDLTGVEQAPQGGSLQPPPTCSELTHSRVPRALIEGLSPESGRTWGLTSVVTTVVAVKPLLGLSWFGPEATSTVSGGAHCHFGVGMLSEGVRDGPR